MIAPAPRKPIPLTTWAAIRVGSVRTSAPLETKKSRNPYAPASVNRHAPSETSRCVRSPASRSRSSRSRPTAAPSTPASVSRSSNSVQVRLGTLAARSSDRLLLGARDPLDPAGCEVEQRRQLVARERLALGRRLHLDQSVVAGHDDVEVDLGARVLHVVEVEQRLAADDA